MTDIKAVLFDVGGVLVDFTGVDAVVGLTRLPMSLSAAKTKWGVSEAILDFEHGRTDEATFAADFVREWDLTLTPDAFLSAFRGWISGPRPGVMAMLKALQPHVVRACFSNTGSIHWRQFGDDGLFEELDHAYASFQIGMMKPSAEAFQHVVADMGLSPETVLFFDDGAANVDGARRAGLQAEAATSLHDLRQALQARGLL